MRTRNLDDMRRCAMADVALMMDELMGYGRRGIGIHMLASSLDIADVLFRWEKDRVAGKPVGDWRLMEMEIPLHMSSCPEPVVLRLAKRIDTPEGGVFLASIESPLKSIDLDIGASNDASRMVWEFVIAKGMEHKGLMEPPEDDEDEDGGELSREEDATVPEPKAEEDGEDDDEEWEPAGFKEPDWESPFDPSAFQDNLDELRAEVQRMMRCIGDGIWTREQTVEATACLYACLTECADFMYHHERHLKSDGYVPDMDELPPYIRDRLRRMGRRHKEE